MFSKIFIYINLYYNKNMESYLPENEYKEFEDRVYINPQTSLGETNTFIDKLRSTQGQRNQEVFTDTQKLGTNVPSNLGGLIGGEGYFTSRYQTPQTNSAVANLRTAAQKTALETALKNEKAIWDKRYQDAYRKYQKRSWDKSNAGGGGGGGGGGTGLNLDTNPDNDSDDVTISQYTNGEYKPGYVYPVKEGLADYQDASGQWWQLSNPTQRDVGMNTVGLGNLGLSNDQRNENTIVRNGQTYMYLDNVPNTDPAWYVATRSAGPGTYSY